MAGGKQLSARIVALPTPWMRAACAVHEREQQLRRFICEMQRECDALVLRMQLMGYARKKDGILARAVRLRNNLAIEGSRAPLLQRWEKTFDALDPASPDLDPELDERLAGEIAACGRPEESVPQLPLSLGGAERQKPGGER